MTHLHAAGLRRPDAYTQAQQHDTCLGGDGRHRLAGGEGGAVPQGEDVGVLRVLQRELVHVDVALWVSYMCVGGEREKVEETYRARSYTVRIRVIYTHMILPDG